MKMFRRLIAKNIGTIGIRFSSVTERFEVAKKAVPLLTKEPTDAIKLRMYALYNQANKGDPILLQIMIRLYMDR